MAQHSSGSAAAAARWATLAALAFVAGLLAGQFAGGGSAVAQTASASGGGVFAIAGQITRDNYGLYLVDPQSATICVYQFLPAERSLRLMAARTFTYDRRLDAYNTEPAPDEIGKLVDQARRMKDAAPATRP